MSHRSSTPFRNNILPYRQKHALSANDLGRLCDISNSFISRIEMGQRLPSLGVAFALELVFGVRASELFPGLHAATANRVAANAAAMSIEVEGKTDDVSERHRELLSGINDRTADAAPAV